MRWKCTVVAVSALATSATGGWAANRTLDITDVATITNDTGASRCLVRHGALDLPDRAVLGTAYLVLDVASLTGTPVDLQVHPILTDWNADNVVWDTGWDRPGGDIHDELYGRVRAAEATVGQRLYFDVTAILNEERDGARFHGLLLTTAPYEGEGLRAEHAPWITEVASARLEVTFRERGRGPGGRSAR